MKTIFSGNPDWSRAEDALKSYKRILDSRNSDVICEYALLSSFFQSLFISDDGYVIDTGNFQDVNREILEDILKKVKKHRRLWKIFMVC